MGLRLIILLALAWAVYALVRRALRKRNAGASHPHAPPVDMVRCEHCGTHLPAPEALHRGEHWYCCEAHRAAAQKKPGNEHSEDH